MNKSNKRSKKDEQKKLMVRVICIALAVILTVSSLLAILPTFFHNEDAEYAAQLQALIDAGLVYQAEDGNYYYTEEYINLLTEGESHEGHDHE